MTVFVDPNRLARGLASSLYHKVLPALPAGSARFTADTAAQMMVQALYRQTTTIKSPDPGAALAAAQEIRQLVKKPVGDADAERLVSLLHSDSRFYAEDDAAYRALISSISNAKRSEFNPPNEDRLSEVLRRMSGDSVARAKIVGTAVGGYSKQTVFFDHMLGDRLVQQLVIRRDLSIAASDRSSVTGEYPVLKVLYEKGLPVAEPLYLEANPRVLETPFMISRRMPGRLYGNSLGLQETPNFDPERTLAEAMAKLHAVDPALVDLVGIADARVDLEAQEQRIDNWIEIYRKNLQIPCVALELGLAWLRANAHHVAGGGVLVHGDVGFHNILYHEGKISALVDWELVHVGNPAEDVAYVISFLGADEPLLTHYEAAGGKRPTEAALKWCHIFGNLRNAIYGVVAMRQFNDGLHDDVSVLPIVLSSYYAYVAALDRNLAQLVDRHGFVWRA